MSNKRLKELVSQKWNHVIDRNKKLSAIEKYLRQFMIAIYIMPRPNVILQLHRDLYSCSQGVVGGTYKNSDNAIAKRDVQGKQNVCFVPVPVFQTSKSMDELCT